MPNTPPYINIDLQEVTTRNHAARHIVAGFSAAMPTLAEIRQYLTDALNDVPDLATELTRLSAELQDTRLDRANLLAAVRATIAAHHDGEPDPMSYLRDELNSRTAPSEDTQERA
jgi:ABC-type transporter Mla subunit MlaD